MAPPWFFAAIGIVTSVVDDDSVTSISTDAPSAAAYAAAPNCTVGPSSSSIDTVAVDGAPSATPAGSVPNDSSTLSLSSSSPSSAAANVKVALVSPDANVTLAGTPE